MKIETVLLNIFMQTIFDNWNMGWFASHLEKTFLMQDCWYLMDFSSIKQLLEHIKIALTNV